MNKTLMEYLAVAGAGALGAALRLFVGRLFDPSGFPLGTFIINITGSLFIGWFVTFIGDRHMVSEVTRLAVATGFVGAYTTFSTFMYETDTLYNKGAAFMAVLYLVTSLAAGLIAVRLGIILAHRM